MSIEYNQIKLDNQYYKWFIILVKPREVVMYLRYRLQEEVGGIVVALFAYAIIGMGISLNFIERTRQNLKATVF